jgi:hypothetical protein
MPHIRQQSLALCSTIALFVAFSAGCDSAVAPEAGSLVADPLQTCQELAYDQPIPPQDPCRDYAPRLCIHPDTGESYVCPIPTERLVFSGASDLEQYLGAIMDAPRADVIAAELQNGFQSLRAYLDAGESTEWGANFWGETDNGTGGEITAMQVDGVTRDDFYFSDAFLSILNHKGEIAIGDSVYKLTRDNVYVVSLANVALLDEKVPTLSSPAPADGDPRILVHPVEIIVDEGVSYTRAAFDAPDGPQYGLFGNRSTCEVYFGPDYRMRGMTFITAAVFFSEAVVKTVWERKKTWPWIHWPNRYQSGTLSHTYTGSLAINYWFWGGAPVYYTYTDTKNRVGVEKIKSSLRWAVSPLGVGIKGHITTTHSVSNWHGTGSCNTYASR